MAGAILTWWTLGQLSTNNTYFRGGINADLMLFNVHARGRSWNPNYVTSSTAVAPELPPEVGEAPMLRDSS